MADDAEPFDAELPPEDYDKLLRALKADSRTKNDNPNPKKGDPDA